MHSFDEVCRCERPAQNRNTVRLWRILIFSRNDHDSYAGSFAEDERQRQAENEDIRTVAGKRELIRTFLNRVRDELLEIVPNMPECYVGNIQSRPAHEKQTPATCPRLK
jgi:hypothetical protein